MRNQKTEEYVTISRFENAAASETTWKRFNE
ncbi:hypothetical protein [Singapore grouper iridovirus]|nr:hypothetical protein [Singapore grouper iridovirus]